MSAQLTCDFKQKQYNSNGVNEDLEEHRCDLIELNKIRRFAKGRCVKEVISLDINVLAAQIESLKDNVSSKENIEIQWSEIVAGRRKTGSHTQHIESNLIPVSNNQYELLNSSKSGETENSNSVRNHPMVRRQISQQRQNIKF